MSVAYMPFGRAAAAAEEAARDRAAEEKDAKAKVEKVPAACPRCGSARFKRNGRTSGTQTYYCHCCRRSFNARTGTPWARLRRPEARRRFRELMQQGLSLRAIAGRLGIAVATAWRWRHQEMAEMAEQQRREGPRLRGRVAVEAVPLDAEQAYWGRLPGWGWRDERRPQAKNQRRGSGLLTMVFAVRVDPDRRLRAAACRVVPGPLTRLTLSRALETCVAAGSRVEARQGTARVCVGALGRRVVRWTPFGATGWEVRRLDLTPARSLRMAFARWMARFRGVAVTYLERYVAWFNAWVWARVRAEGELALGGE